MAHPTVKKELERFALTTILAPDPRFQEYKINGTPTLIALGSSGPIRKIGFMPPSELVQWLQGVK